MTSDEKASEGRGYVVIGSGNITAGTFTNSQVISQSGRAEINNAPIADMQPWLDQLRNELTRIRLRLEQAHPAVPAADIEDAIETITAVHASLLAEQDTGPADLRRVRRRLKELMGVLAPVAEIVGGIAALEAILQHL